MTTQQEETAHPLRCEHNLELHKGLVLDKEKRLFKGLIVMTLIMLALALIPMIPSKNKENSMDVTYIIAPLGAGIFFLSMVPSLWRARSNAKPDKSKIPIPGTHANGVLHVHTAKDIFIYYIVGLFILGATLIPFIIVSSGLNHLDHLGIMKIIILLKQDRALLPALALLLVPGITLLLLLKGTTTHIDLDSYGLKIYTKGAFTSLFTKKKILCDQPWENLTKVYIKQRFTSYYQLHDEQHHTFEILANLFVDPCWLNYITTTCINLPNAQQRHHFLTHLRDYAPTQGKIVTT